MTLTGFLLAKIAEDEKWASEHEDVGDFLNFEEDVCARVLADCEAKRRIVGLHGGDYDGECQSPAHLDGPCRTLRALASAYADHPDYRGEWRV